MKNFVCRIGKPEQDRHMAKNALMLCGIDANTKLFISRKCRDVLDKKVPID
jgi:hypothetical protein